jgi:hypothetical protein
MSYCLSFRVSDDRWVSLHLFPLAASFPRMRATVSSTLQRPPRVASIRMSYLPLASATSFAFPKCPKKKVTDCPAEGHEAIPSRSDWLMGSPKTYT